MVQILDGKKVSADLLNRLTTQIADIKQHHTHPPKLSVVLVGDNPASEIYVSRKAKAARQIGLLSDVYTFSDSISEQDLLLEIERLNHDPGVHGILVQLPLPKHIDTLKVLNHVSPSKDVDGFHPLNLGKLLMGQLPPALPCTPAGIMTLLKEYQIPLAGKNAVIVGRSNIVGKPISMLLLQENATVTICHSKTKNLSDVLQQADIIIAAVGIPELIKGSDVAPGAVVVDVGINRREGSKEIVGDVAYAEVAEKAAYITPVPGGVGPMTIATLMANTVALYQESLQHVSPC